MKKKKDWNKAKDFEITYRDQKYNGRYLVHGRLVSVTSSYGEKTTQFGGSPPESIAKLLLAELVRESGK